VLAISANSTLVDATGVDGLAVGDEAVLIGRQGDERIATDEIARVIGSHYRVLAGIPAAAPRLLR
jgi:alanine racemase